MALSSDDFIKDPQVMQTLSDLRQYALEHPLRISDVSDAEGHQYVDLVQEGGGVLGIALVGYTYVLEEMGVRFFSMAGTSAGSINTMLLATAGNREDAKSGTIIDRLARLNMFTFVDGIPGNRSFTRFIKKFISKMLMGQKPFSRIQRTFLIFFAIFLVLILGSFALAFWKPALAKWVGGLGIISLIVFLVLTLISIRLFKQFAKNGYGLNEGKVFHNWIRDTISSFHVHSDPAQPGISNLEHFSRHFLRLPPGLTVTPDPRRSLNLPPTMPLITLITCDIIAERKIEFTRMWDLYWNDPAQVHPGDFVRASMSIPVFFETFTVSGIRQRSTLEKWKEQLNWENSRGDIPDTAQFIDGGTLSNFPINVFYNPNYPVPRMPTLGIRLQDGNPDGGDRKTGSLSGYLRSLFSTIRFNYDRDFIIKNRAYNLAVKNIDVREFNWLNFFISDKDKIRLFQAGVSAAAEFLRDFDWEQYKTERLKNFEMQQERFEDPNNLKQAQRPE